MSEYEPRGLTKSEWTIVGHVPTPAQLRYLDAIAANPGMSYRALRDAVGTSSPHGTWEMVQRLRKYGYVDEDNGAGIRLSGGER